MKPSQLSVLTICLVFCCIVGCGGHEGGVIDLPPDQNPYQLTDQEQRAMNASIDETEGLEDELKDQEPQEGEDGEGKQGEGAEGDGPDAGTPDAGTSDANASSE